MMKTCYEVHPLYNFTILNNGEFGEGIPIDEHLCVSDEVFLSLFQGGYSNINSTLISNGSGLHL